MKKLYYWVFLALLVAYLALSIFLPPDPSTLEKFNITSSQAKMLSMTVVIPISFIYLLALYGTVWFKSFAESVRKTKEGPAYGQMADGLMIMALSLPLHSVFSSLNNYVANYYPHWIEEMVIARNYMRVILTVIAFTFIARGAERLVRTVRTKITFDRPLLSLFGTITLTTLYVWLIITRHHVEAVSPVYYQPDWMILFTQAIPLLFVWSRGLRAMYHLYAYREKVGGKVYRRSLDMLAKGVALTIFVAIGIQFVMTASNRLVAVNLTPTLVIVYLLVVGYAVSFAYVAAGAKRLKMIEEV